MRKLPQLLRSHRGKFALMRDRAIIDFFDSPGDAYKVGLKNYGVGDFSIQEVTDATIDLGFFNRAVPQRPV